MLFVMYILRLFDQIKHSSTKTGRHDIAEILLKMALNTTNQINHS
jgi:hypothetical protein